MAAVLTSCSTVKIRSVYTPGSTIDTLVGDNSAIFDRSVVACAKQSHKRAVIRRPQIINVASCVSYHSSSDHNRHYQVRQRRQDNRQQRALRYRRLRILSGPQQDSETEAFASQFPWMPACYVATAIIIERSTRREFRYQVSNEKIYCAVRSFDRACREDEQSNREVIAPRESRAMSRVNDI